MPKGARDATSRLPQASSRRTARRENFELLRWIDADRPVWSYFRISPIDVAWPSIPHLLQWELFCSSLRGPLCHFLNETLFRTLRCWRVSSAKLAQYGNRGGGGVVVSLRFGYILYTCWIEYATFRAEAQSSTTFSFPSAYCTARRYWVVILKMTRGKVVLRVVAFPCCANFCGSVLHATKLSIYS